MMSHQKVPPGTPLDFSLLGEPHEQGLVFKWGSLVGIEMPTTGASGTPFRGDDDVEFTPAGFTGVVTTDWTSVPWCATDFGDYGNTAIDHLADVNDPVRGIGDICRYMGDVDGSRWRTPTAAQWAELYNFNNNGGESVIRGATEWTNGNYFPLRGRAFGAGQSYVSVTGNGTDALVINADPWINGAVFLPPSGWRNYNNGAIIWIGSVGQYRSSTALDAANGCFIQFDSGNIWPQRSYFRTCGLSIRCIRE